MIETTSAHAKTVRGTMTGETIGMTIDAEQMGFVMKTLADMYADKVKAIIREYSCNARDAMVEAERGDHPIEVTLPGPLSPFLTIKDTGIGMSKADIQRVYSRYGASTKRDTNAQVGKFGIGSKAALAYADQFTLVGSKDGTRIQVAISRNKKGGGDMTIVDESPTTEPNGVEIVIPVATSDVSDFELKAKEFFGYWERGMVLVNGAEPKSFLDDAIAIPGMDAWVVKSESARHNRSTVIMGNVPYPANFGVDLGYQHYLVARVPIGACDIPPARESLRTDDPTTQRTLAKIKADYAANAGKTVQAKVDQATTKQEAFDTVKEWAVVLKAKGPYKWRGQKVPLSISVKNAVSCGDHGNDWREHDPQCSKCKQPDPQFYCLQLTKGDWTYFERTRTVPLDYIDRYDYSVVIEGYDRADKPTATVKKKIMQYLDEHYPGVYDRHRAMMFRGTLSKENEEALTWVKPLLRLKWADIWATKLPRAHTQNSNGKPAGAYRVFSPPDASWQGRPRDRSHGVTVKDTPADELPAKPVWQNESASCKYHAATLDTDVVYVPVNRQAKFLRENPKAVTVSEYRAKLRDKWLAALSEDEKTVLSKVDRYYWNGGNPLRGWNCLDGMGVKDPEVLNLIRLGKLDVSKVGTEMQEYGFNRTDVQPTKPFTDPRAAYRLLAAGLSKEQAEHAVLYINAVYAAKKKGA